MKWRCECPKNRVGQFCEILLSECQMAGCFEGNGVVCEKGECVCPDWRSGLKCNNYIGVCNSATCNGKGNCADSGKNMKNGEKDEKLGFLCDCDDNFCGMNCEHEIKDVCESNPCVNSYCVSTINHESCESEYNCECKFGRTGTNCETETGGACSSDPCENEGECYMNGLGFTCVCKNQYTGEVCSVYQRSTIEIMTIVLVIVSFVGGLGFIVYNKLATNVKKAELKKSSKKNFNRINGNSDKQRFGKNKGEGNAKRRKKKKK